MNEPNEHDSNPALDAVAKILNAASPAATRMSIRRRRMLRALDDLRLLDAVGGANFVQIADNGLEFQPLDDRHSDRLVTLLEDLAARNPRHTPRPARAQLALGDDSPGRPHPANQPTEGGPPK